ncbi:putative protein TPRXL [Panthera leo]|uniref:putative protein TPRXL n=1 Tax=Panthera leo TaxID=9689 RepID=UPI001C6A6E40|nr:putative protein TPRXL [Panthera leo]
MAAPAAAPDPDPGPRPDEAAVSVAAATAPRAGRARMPGRAAGSRGPVQKGRGGLGFLEELRARFCPEHSSPPEMERAGGPPSREGAAAPHTEGPRHHRLLPLNVSIAKLAPDSTGELEQSGDPSRIAAGVGAREPCCLGLDPASSTSGHEGQLPSTLCAPVCFPLEGAPESSSPERCAPSSSSGAPHGGTADGGETFPARHAWSSAPSASPPSPEMRVPLEPAGADPHVPRPPPRASPRGGNETDDGFRRRPLTPAASLGTPAEAPNTGRPPVEPGSQKATERAPSRLVPPLVDHAGPAAEEGACETESRSRVTGGLAWEEVTERT